MKKLIIIRWLLFIGGLLIVTFGANLILYANLGTTGIDAFAVGLAERYGLSLGAWINIISLILILTGAIMSKRGKIISAILASMLVGLFFDLWAVLLFNHLRPVASEIWKGIIFLIGLVIAPSGTALYILANVATSSMDYMMLSINKRFHLSIQNSRIILDVLFVIGAIWVKGPIGKATIILMVTYGPILQIYYKFFNDMLKKTDCREWLPKR